MKVEFFDDYVDVRELTLGRVLFITDSRDRNNPDLYVPCHLKGFTHVNDRTHMVVLVDFMIKTIDPLLMCVDRPMDPPLSIRETR